MNELMTEWMDILDGWMDGWMDGWTDVSTNIINIPSEFIVVNF